MIEIYPFCEGIQTVFANLFRINKNNRWKFQTNDLR